MKDNLQGEQSKQNLEAIHESLEPGAILSHRSEIRDAFLRKYHRANRWHLAAIAMAEKMQFFEGQPAITH